MSFIDVRDVGYRYSSGQSALDGISLSIEKGENIAVIGQNGAGKTTLVKLLNGLLKPTDGDVFINGVNTKELTAARLAKSVGYVFQNPDDQIFHSDVESEIAFAPKLLGLRGDELDERVQWAARLCGVDKRLRENPYSLAYSMRKFVTVASVLALIPDALILDEPTAGQDPGGQIILKNLISEYNGMGKTVITITHDMEFVADNFKRTVVMADMKKIGDGPTQEIFRDDDLLEAAALTRTCAGRLARGLGMTDNVLTVEDFLTAAGYGR